MPRTAKKLRTRFVGSGAGGKVYKKNKTTVVKYFYEDTGYETFLKALSTEADNPFFPKIKKATIGTENSGRVEMECLNKLDWDNSDCDHFPYLAIERAVVKSSKNKNYNLCEDDDLWMLAGNEVFMRAFDLLAKTLRKNSGRIYADMHEDNWMKRNDGHYVMIDPFYNDD
jgi:hypothetical protein